MVSHVPLLLLLCTAGYICSVQAGEDSGKPKDSSEKNNDKQPPLANVRVDVPLLARLKRHHQTGSCNECQEKPYYPPSGGGGGGGGSAIAVATYHNYNGGGGNMPHPGCDTCNLG